MFNFYKNNIEITPLTNIKQIELFARKLRYTTKEYFEGNYSRFMKYFNDFNVNNYILCYIYIEDEYKTFDEKLYNEYHKNYFKYYSKNPDIKLIVFSNNHDWCSLNFKFFNTCYIRFIDNQKILR